MKKVTGSITAALDDGRGAAVRLWSNVQPSRDFHQ
jgi:hypothetical protein